METFDAIDAFGTFDTVSSAGAEQVSITADEASGLRAIVAVHSTVLGPGLGGTRFYPYPDEGDALVDVLRLARAMTYKHAVCGNPFGGGKGVIIGDHQALRSDALFEAYGRFIDRLGGRYLTAEDVGTTVDDMRHIRVVTPFVTGLPIDEGGSGDPSPATAWGVFHAMRAVAERLWGDASLGGRQVVVVGVGKVGSALVGHLLEAGATVTVADVNDEAVAQLVTDHDVASVTVSDAHRTECDVLSPCALGATLNASSIADLGCAAVCGAANNQLATDADGERLAARGVLYAPDFVANAGGVINLRDEATGAGYDRDVALERVAGIYDTMCEVLDLATSGGITPAEAANDLAEARIARFASR